MDTTSISFQFYLALHKSVPRSYGALAFGGIVENGSQGIYKSIYLQIKHIAECAARWDGPAYALMALFLVQWK